MSNQRVTAFTLMEITIAMLISALLIGMTYTIYTIVTHSFAIFTQKNNTMAMVSRLNELLKKDFDHADRIEKTEDGIAMTYNGQNITYHIVPSAIMRIGSTTDTFKVAVINANTSFEDHVVNATATGTESSRIDDLNMQFATENDTLNGRYHKTYSSVNLINRNAHAIN